MTLRNKEAPKRVRKAFAVGPVKPSGCYEKYSCQVYNRFLDKELSIAFVTFIDADGSVKQCWGEWPGVYPISDIERIMLCGQETKLFGTILNNR